MNVTLLAQTAMLPLANSIMPFDNTAKAADRLGEFAGRACYQSFGKPNPNTAANADYIENIIRLGHESVLEHASATFYIEGVSRSLTHELVRHRHLSFSQLSQRYVDSSHASFVTPPAIRDLDDEKGLRSDIYDDLTHYFGDGSLGGYDKLVAVLEGQGLSRKRAREAARCVLPNAIETKIVVTGNMRAWRHVITMRGSLHADAEIRQLAVELLRQLHFIAPATFQEFKILDDPEQGKYVVREQL